MQVDLVLDCRNIVGESLVWDDRTAQLIWIDIPGRRVFRLDPQSGALQSWETGPEFPTSIGLCSDGGAIVGLTQRVALWDFEGPFRTLAVPEPDGPGHRLNEGRVAPDGSFWVASMQNNLDTEGRPVEISGARGRLWRVAPDGRTRCLSPDRFAIPNTMVWLDDGRFVIGDTVENSLYVHEMDAQGQLGPRRPFAAPFGRGLPDGSCLDAEGAIWTARVVGGACLTRTLPDGTLDQVVELPCSWPTSCCFGGSDLATLYVTSARFTLSDDHLAAHPREGALWSLRPGVTGRQEHRFG
jgi:sugar lactone lactonase YvrE